MTNGNVSSVDEGYHEVHPNECRDLNM